MLFEAKSRTMILLFSPDYFPCIFPLLIVDWVTRWLLQPSFFYLSVISDNGWKHMSPHHLMFAAPRGSQHCKGLRRNRKREGWERPAKTEVSKKQREGNAWRQSNHISPDREKKDRKVSTRSINVEVISALVVLVDWWGQDELGMFWSTNRWGSGDSTCGELFWDAPCLREQRNGDNWTSV